MTSSSSTRNKRRRLSPAARRAELLEAVEAVIVERGLAKVTVPLVVARAGVAQGSFYRYFSDLDEALGELAQQVIAPIAHAAFSLDVSRAHDAAEVEQELLGYYRVLAAELGARSALVREVLLAGFAGRGAVGELLTTFLAAMREHVRSLTAIHAGSGPFDVGDPDITAGTLVGMVLGASHEAVRAGEAFDAEHWAHELARAETKLICAPQKQVEGSGGTTTPKRPTKRK